MSPQPAPTVWIVDDDLGFVWWLGEVFIEAGCHTLPALSATEALALMKRLQVSIDIVVVNPALAGVDRMLRSLKRANPGLKIIIIGPGTLTSATMRVHGTLIRPSAFEPLPRPEWLDKVRVLLREVKAAAV